MRKIGPSGRAVKKTILWEVKGGYFIRLHAKELPWIQLELSREEFLSNEGKSEAVLQALADWCNRLHE